MRAFALAVALAGCGGAPALELDAGASCAPISYTLCIIPELPPPIVTWHCTDGKERGRAWCAICSPAQRSEYCPIGGQFSDPAQNVVCVGDCASCQPPGWPRCR